MKNLIKRIRQWFTDRKVMRLKLEQLTDYTLIDRMLGDTEPYIKK
jgi:hypothetical protein